MSISILLSLRLEQTPNVLTMVLNNQWQSFCLSIPLSRRQQINPRLVSRCLALEPPNMEDEVLHVLI